MRKILRVLTLAIAAYVALLLLLFFAQRKLIYLPWRASESAVLQAAQVAHLEPWRNAKNEIIGWRAPRRVGTPEPANRLVVFHGNAGYALLRTHFVEGFSPLGGGALWDVLLFEYPGFGARGGSTGEASFIKAATEALEELSSDARPIYLLGESLGSGLASALAQRMPEKIAGVFLLTPYASLAEVAGHHYRFVPVRLILRDRWDNLSALREFRGPLAVMLAENDEVIPAQQARRIFELAREPKRLWVQRGASHNTIDFDPAAPWWREVSEFLLQARAAREANAGSK